MMDDHKNRTEDQGELEKLRRRIRELEKNQITSEIIASVADLAGERGRAWRMIEELKEKVDGLNKENSNLAETVLELGKKLGIHERPHVEKTATNNWSRELPLTIGWYWFCGWRTKWLFDNMSIPSLHALKVVISGNNHLIYLCDGSCMVKEDNPIGFFLPLETPEVPEMPRYDNR